MVKERIHILFLFGSIILIILAGKKLFYPTSDIRSHTSPSFEVEQVVNKALHTHTNIPDKIGELFPNIITESIPSKRWLMIFVTGASHCSNCLNEITDYIKLADDDKFLFENSKKLLISHSEDLATAKRFILASEINSIVDDIAFIKSSDLEKITLVGESPSAFEYQNFLFLMDLQNHKAFHQFLLPVGKITAFNSKQAALNNAIRTYTNNQNQKKNES